LTDINDVIALCFCVTKDHARFMSGKFNKVGLKSDYLVSGRDGVRSTIKSRLLKKEINYLFVVDIFNEGVDIPEIDTILFLRPTESLTVFLQQLGRGLRFADKKECLTVLDFVGNARDEYDFEGKFRSLVGKSNNSIKDEIENEFPHLPLGCSIILEKKAKEHILNNIKKATSINRKKLINKIVNYKHQTSMPLSIGNFIKINHMSLDTIYKKDSFSSLCYEAGVIEKYDNVNEKELVRAISKKWLFSNSISYLQFILKIIKNDFDVTHFQTQSEKLMAMMLYYDFWQDANKFKNLEEGVKYIGNNRILVQELKEVIHILVEKINYLEIELALPYACPIKGHARYTREQVLSAFGHNTLDKKSSSREGVLNIRDKNTELLFVTLEKTEDKYSPTTMYNDYAISDTLFHWQSQNSTKPDSPKGLSYINQSELKKHIILFVREKNYDKNKNTMTYICLGKVFYSTYYGSQPMNITWKLENKIPPFLWKSIAKMAVG